MRILFISDITSIHAVRWVRYMVKRGHAVSVLSVRPGSIKGADVIFQDPGDMPAPVWLRRIRHSLFILREWRMIKFGNFDIVHVHFLRADLIGLTAARHPRCVISVWGSDVRPPDEGGYPRRLALRRMALERAALVIATNPFLEDMTRMMAPTVKRIEIIPFGVSLTDFNRENWKAGKPDEVRFCVPKLRLKPLYGQDIAIKALVRVVKHFPRTVLILLGEGDDDYLNELKEMVAKYKLQGNVHFVGRVDGADISRVFDQCDVLLQPSRWDSFGVIILEGAAYCLPTIASCVGGVTDLVLEGITGLTFPPGDDQALAEAMIKLAEDPQYRTMLGNNAYEMVSEFYQFDMHAEQMEVLYKCLCGEEQY